MILELDQPPATRVPLMCFTSAASDDETCSRLRKAGVSPEGGWLPGTGCVSRVALGGLGYLG
jgi:hypothetical protein